MFINPKISVRPTASRNTSMLSCTPLRTWIRKCCTVHTQSESGEGLFESERFRAAWQIAGARKLIQGPALHLAVGPLDDLDHVDLLKQGTVLRIEPDLSARRIERQVSHRGDELGAIFGHYAAELLEGQHDRLAVIVTKLRAHIGILLVLRVKRLHELLVRLCLDAGIMRCNVLDVERQIAQSGPQRFVIDPMVADQGNLCPQSEVSMLLDDLDRLGTCIEGVDNLCAGVCGLRQCGAVVLGLLEWRPDFLNHLSAVVLKAALESADKCTARRIIRPHRDGRLHTLAGPMLSGSVFKAVGAKDVRAIYGLQNFPVI